MARAALTHLASFIKPLTILTFEGAGLNTSCIAMTFDS